MALHSAELCETGLRSPSERRDRWQNKLAFILWSPVEKTISVGDSLSLSCKSVTQHQREMADGCYVSSLISAKVNTHISVTVSGLEVWTGAPHTTTLEIPLSSPAQPNKRNEEVVLMLTHSNTHWWCWTNIAPRDHRIILYI